MAQLMAALYRRGDPVAALATFADYRARLARDLGLDPGVELVDLQQRILARDPALSAVHGVGFSLRGYRLGQRLGTGRDGTVFAARIPGVERDFALRVYRDGFADDPQVVECFERQARALAAVEHPALVPVLDAWREPGLAAVVMARMVGGTLGDRVGRRTLSFDEASLVVERVGGALLALHERGISHSRLHEGNVLFDAAGAPFLADATLGARNDGSSDARDFVHLAARCLGQDGAHELAGLASSPGLDVPSAVEGIARVLHAAPPRPSNPYVGLRAFTESDAAVFHGRSSFVQQLLDRMTQRSDDARLLLVVAGSGSGKSSVVRAGLLPALTSSEPAWIATSMMPGVRPWKSLEQALQRVEVVGAASSGLDPTDSRGLVCRLAAIAANGRRLLLLLDQLEELFVLCDPPERDSFLEAIADAVTASDSPLYVVATVRADYFAGPLEHPVFGPLAAPASLALPAMTPAEVEQAIAGPAAGRLTLEPGLTAELVGSVAGQPGALPALQFALREMAQRSPGSIGLADLRAIGGVDGAIATRAEALFGDLSPSEQDVLRRMLERLFVISEDGEPTRRRAARTELVSLVDDPPVAERLLEEWISARLLAADCRPDTREPTVEIVHEAVLDRWPRLREWIGDGRERRLLVERLTRDATTWDSLGREDDALLRGARLEQAVIAVEHAGREVDGLARTYVAHSQARKEADDDASAQAAADRERTTRRLRHQRWALAAALAVTLGLAAAALSLLGVADRNEAAAEARAQAATAGLIAASEEAGESDWALALLLAAEAYRIDESPLTAQGLVSALTNPRPVPTTLHRDDSAYSTVAIDPDSDLVAARSAEGLVDVLDPDTGAVVHSDLPSMARPGSGGLDASHGLVAASGLSVEGDGAVVYRVETGAVAAALPAQRGISEVAFDPDARRLAAAVDLAQVWVYDVATWEPVSVLATPAGELIESIVWSRDGQRVYAGTGDAVYGWETSSADQTSLGSPRPPDASADLGESLNPIEVVTDLETVGEHVLAVRSGVGAYLLDAADLELVERLPAGAAVFRAAASPDGERVVLSGDLVAQVLPLGQAASTVAARLSGGINDVAFTTLGKPVTVGTAGDLVVWDLQQTIPGMEPVDIGTGFPQFDADGSYLAVYGLGVRLLDGKTYEQVASPDLGDPPMTNVLGVAYQSDLNRIVVSSCPNTPWDASEVCDAELRAFDLTSGDLLAGPVSQGRVAGDATSQVVADPAGNVVASAELGAAVTLRDPETLEPVAVLDDVPGSPTVGRAYLRLSSDSSLLMASIHPDQRVAVWDVAAPGPVPALWHDNVGGVPFFTPDGTVVTGTDGAAMQHRDGRTGALLSEFDELPSINRATFTLDGALMGTSGPDQAAWLWTTSPWQPMAGPIDLGGRGWDTVHPDGSHLLVHGSETYRFPLDPAQWFDLACQTAERNLTQREWQRYFSGDRYRQTCPRP